MYHVPQQQQQLLRSHLKRINWPACLRRAMASSSPAPTQAGIKKRAVAGSFLFKIPHGDEKHAKVALFRRSGEVRTYQHKLAPLSGSVEPDDPSPMATALREIQEETTLTSSSLELLRVGKPYSFADHSIGREWTINPFAFRLKDVTEGGRGETGITLDWEHEGIEWFDPLDVKGSDEFGGVPKLVNSLRRVWPEYDLGSRAARVLTDGLQTLRNDHESGARQLAATSVSILKGIIVELGSTSLDELWWAKIRMAAWHLCKVRESMGAAITTAIVRALHQVEVAFLLSDLAPADKLRRIVEGIDAQLDKRKTSTAQICNSLVAYLRQNALHGTESKKEISILTLSSSSTISSSLVQAVSSLGVTLNLHVLESRPLYEGVTLASKLLEVTDQKKAGVNVTIYSDASAALAARGIDVLVLGADRLSSAGDVSNKIGSLPAVLSARHVAPGSKVVILSETEKIAGPGLMDEHEAEENDPAELTRAWQGSVKGADIVENTLQAAQSGDDHPRVAVKNVYFEWVPAHLVDAYATEEGIWTVEDIAKRSQWIGKEIERFFKDL